MKPNPPQLRSPPFSKWVVVPHFEKGGLGGFTMLFHVNDNQQLPPLLRGQGWFFRSGYTMAH